jgi:hypothetical protein
MSLRLRRGTDGERLAITPEAGELIFTTDTNTVYVGDGSTPGGIIVSAGGVTLADLGDTSIGSVNNGDLLGYNSGSGKWEPTRFVDTDITGSVFAKDSAVLVDANAGLITGTVDTDSVTATGTITANAFVGDITGSVTGDVTGNVTGNVVGNTTGYHTGDITGSLFAVDSTLLVDAINGDIFANDIQTASVKNPVSDLQLSDSGTGNITIGNVITLTPGNGEVVLRDNQSISKDDDIARISFTRNSTGGGAISEDTAITRLTYNTKIGSNAATVLLTNEIREEAWILIPSPGGVGDSNKTLRFNKEGKLGINGLVTSEPDANLHVTGNVKISGGELLLGNMDETTRDALTAANGMMIYNTTANKFQGYENGAWVNLI